MQSPPVVAVLSVELHFPSSNSLKEKRRILKSVKDRAHAKFNVSVAEIDFHDKWQRSVLGAAMIGNDRAYLDRALQNILSLVEKTSEVQLMDQELQFI